MERTFTVQSSALFSVHGQKHNILVRTPAVEDVQAWVDDVNQSAIWDMVLRAAATSLRRPKPARKVRAAGGSDTGSIASSRSSSSSSVSRPSVSAGARRSTALAARGGTALGDVDETAEEGQDEAGAADTGAGVGLPRAAGGTGTVPRRAGGSAGGPAAPTPPVGAAAKKDSPAGAAGGAARRAGQEEGRGLGEPVFPKQQGPRRLAATPLPPPPVQPGAEDSRIAEWVAMTSAAAPPPKPLPSEVAPGLLRPDARQRGTEEEGNKKRGGDATGGGAAGGEGARGRRGSGSGESATSEEGSSSAGVGGDARRSGRESGRRRR